MISTTQLLDIIKSDENLTLEQLLLQVPEIDFVTYLETLLLKKDVSKSELIKMTNLHRTYAYQIFNGQKKPSRSKIIQIALALQLDIRETNNLLSLSDNGYLYPKVRYDAIILYALEHKKSIIDTNLILDMYELPILE
ncbi:MULTISPECIES: helix-turn-helix transcriptional regulator [unclassified Thomasclavelia]|uniref:Helix-turn-helix transcriptional regulator n=1 Tax=Candidatus Erysipelatoclostridium merdavium TaxID=2838566 RepID=A0A9D1XM25_9FIRM|nr:helix-turn-helix transcriptional regulator [Erysipelatoclostridium sp. An15]HIX81983.1 helix-turn-helix transcriptional regulator [Candidatus Erysipelatoclostridium merdavium]